MFPVTRSPQPYDATDCQRNPGCRIGTSSPDTSVSSCFRPGRSRSHETVLPETPTVQEPERWYVYEPYIDAIRCRIRPALMDVDLRLLAAEAAEAELAARMIAMQGATDNADELLHELNLSYNRIRQQLVTNELQDISGTRTGLNK